MNIFKKIYANYLNKKRLNWRKKNLQPKLTNTNFTIISNNCSAGFIYNNLGHQFLTPTINLQFTDEDYLTLIYNLKEFVENGELTEVEQTGLSYPVGQLTAPCGSIKIYFLHYDNFQHCYDKWMERCKRINWDNMCFLFEAKAGTTQQDIKKFDDFNSKNKAIIGMDLEIDSPNYYKIVSNQTDHGGLIFFYQTKNSPKRWLDEYDYVSLINSIKENN